MKNLLLKAALLLCCNITLFAQNKVAERVEKLNKSHFHFKEFLPLTPTNDIDKHTYNNGVTNASFAIINKNIIKDIEENKYPEITLNIPYNNSVIKVQLYRTELLAKGFHLDTDTAPAKSYNKGAHYRGIIENNPESLASFSFYEDEMYGMISSETLKNLNIGKIKNSENYVIYSDADLVTPVTFGCHTETTEHLQEKSTLSTNDEPVEKCVSVFLEIQHEMYLYHDSDETALTNYIMFLFNNMQAIYYSDGVNLALQSMFIWTEEDPYQQESALDYLEQYYDSAEFDGDIAVLVSHDNNYGGIAAMGAGCETSKVCYCDLYYTYTYNLPIFSIAVKIITHEVGHVLSSAHTHDCSWNGNNTAIDGCGTLQGYPGCNGPIPDEGGTIMSYCDNVTGVNFQLGFGPQPSAKIQQYIQDEPCYNTGNCIECSMLITNFAVTNSTLTSATVTWEDESGGPWQVAISSLNGTNVEWLDAFSNSYTFDELSPSTYYNFYIRPACSQGEPYLERKITFATADNWCDGEITFTDNGGANNDYGDNYHMIRTLKPAEPNHYIIVDFTEFDLQDGYDFLYIYNGPDTHAPLIGKYSWEGEVFEPHTIESTAEDGSLTFVFTSNEVNTSPGWVANVTCIEILKTEQLELKELTYSPNPTNGIVNITAAETITDVWIYNVAGQLLMHKNVNSNDVTADINSFAQGVYFFKVNNGTKEANFRIVKQ